MKVLEGYSCQGDGVAAVDEAISAWSPEDCRALNMVFAFCSTAQDASAVAIRLGERLPGVPVAGCTTSGEHLSGQHFNGSLVVAGLCTPAVQWATARIEGLAEFDGRHGAAVADKLFAQLGYTRDEVDPRTMFCLMFIDGLSLKEEHVVSVLADSLEGVPLLGGSAGDDLKFERTRVLAGGMAASDAAVLVMGHTEYPFKVVKYQHFVATPTMLAITKADIPNRRVIEIDGIPAADAYARALGKARDDITDDITFLHPMTFLCHGEIYVRSIQKVEDDGSLVFYCGIEEGMVLDIGGHEDMVSRLDADLAVLSRGGKADLFLACNCVLRALEANQKNYNSAIGKAFKRAARHTIGFDTYGEQLNGLHINQTLVGLAFTQ